MKFPFAWELEPAGDGVSVATIEGYLVIEADQLGTEPGAERPEWSVAEIVLHGYGDKRPEIALADGHWLHDRLLTCLLNTYRDEIDRKWDSYIRAAIAGSRRGFLRLARKPDPANAP